MSDRPAPTDPPLELLLAQGQWVRALANRLVADDDTADEAVQRVWLAAVERPPATLRSPRGWLAAALVNALRRLRRAEGRRERHEHAAAAPERGVDVADVVARAEIQERVARAVLALEEPYRTTVLLRFVDDRPPSEIATRMGVPVETVRTRLRRAVERLRRALGVEGDRDGRSGALALLLVPSAQVPARRPPLATAVVGGGTVAAAKKTVLGIVVLLLLGVSGGAVAIHVATRSNEPSFASIPGEDRARAAASRERESPRRASPDDAPVPGTHSGSAAAALDLDRDLRGVVVREDGTPVAGAEIRAVRFPWRRLNFLNPAGYEREEPGPATASAEDGTFALRLVPGEQVSLRVRAQGFAPVSFHDQHAGARVRIVLSEGVRLRLVVVDGSGATVPGVALRIRARGGPERGNATAEVTTDSSGVAVASGLPPGGEAWIETRTAEHGDQTWWDVPLAAAGESERRLELVPARTLRGRVTDAATGEPIAGATVGINWVADHPVTTREDGTFVLVGWTGVGTREIAASAPGYAGAEETVGTRETIDFALRRGFALEGRVVDADGAPVAGALVAAIASVHSDGEQTTSSGHTVSGDDGRFRTDGLAPAMTHFVTAAAPGHARTRIEVPPPGDTGVVSLGDVALGRPHALVGRAADAEGRPIPHLNVTVQGPLPGNERYPANGYGLSEDRVADASGRFVVVDLPPGRYVVSAEPYRNGQAPFETEVTIEPGREVTEMTLSRPATRALLVRVRDEVGLPVAGVEVDAVGESDEVASGSTSAAGDVVLHLLPGHEQVCVLGADSSRPFLDLPSLPIPPDVREMTLVLREGVFLEIVVLDPEGRPVPAAEVRISGAGGEVRSERCGSEGRGRFAVERAESWTVTFDGFAAGRDTGLSGRAGVVAPASAAVVRAQRVAADRTLSVRVVTPDGAAVPGVAVFLADGPDFRGVGATDAAGRLALRDLAPREVFLSTHPHGEFAAPRSFGVLPAGQEVTLTLRRTAALRGVVVDAAGAPAFAVVAADAGDEGTLVTAPTAEDGSFVLRIPDDERGPFRLTARKAHDQPVVGSLDDVAPGATELRIVLSTK